LGGLERLPVFSELPNLAPSLAPFGRPEVQAAVERLLEAGTIAHEWTSRADAFIEARAARGEPSYAGAFSKAPFDLMTDTFRHKKSSLLDVTRHGDLLTEALATLTPLAVHIAVEGIERSGNPLVFIPLHTGDDAFLSPEQFERFYWKPLKRVLEGIIEAGGVPLPFAEGVYRSRIEYFLELPKGSVCWMIDRTDMAEAKRKVGGHCCLAGNVPASLFLMDDPKEITQYCQRLIDEAAPGGGFMIASGAALDRANRPMIEAMIETTMRRGWY
jgi:uroporphyrinogen-III decarboxylase